MSRSDKFSLAITALATAVGFLVGGPVWGFALLMLGIVFFVSYLYHPDQNTADGILNLTALPETGAADIQKSDKLSDHDPRIVPSFEQGLGGNNPSVQDDRIVLTNYGGTDALDVQVREIDTGFTRVRFRVISLIPPKQCGEAVPDLYGTVIEDGNPREVKIPFHDLIAYCEDAVSRGAEPAWESVVTYRDYSDNQFHTKFTLSYHLKTDEITLGGFVFSRL